MIIQNAQIKTELRGMRAWESVYQYKIIGYFHIAFMMIIVLVFYLKEKKACGALYFYQRAAGGNWRQKGS